MGRHPGLDPMPSHQAGDSVLADPDAMGLQLPVDSRAAIGAATALMYLKNLFEQRGIVLPTLARPPLSPSVIAATSDTIEVAHQRDGVGFPVCFDELEDFRF